MQTGTTMLILRLARYMTVEVSSACNADQQHTQDEHHRKESATAHHLVLRCDCHMISHSILK